MKDALAGLRQSTEMVLSRPVFGVSVPDLAELVVEAFAISQMCHAVVLRLVREAHARDVAESAGASSTAGWLRDVLRVAPATGSQLVKLAVALDASMPETAAALATGVVNLEQVKAIRDAVVDLPVECRVEAEKCLLEHVDVFGPRELARAGERIVFHVAPELAEREAAEALRRAEQRAYTGRDLFLGEAPAGRVRLTAWLDREGGAVVRAAIDALSAPRLDLTGPDGSGVDPRTPGQRRADALVDVCRLGLACGELPDNGGDRPQVTVTIPLAALQQQIGVGTLDDGGEVTAETARRMACDAGMLPAVLGGRGQVLDLGQQRRLFTGPVRRALVLRDRGCAFPACDRPARWTDGHHIVHWADGGPTCLANAVLLCGFHHRLIHHGTWRVQINPGDGLPEFTPPFHLDPLQRPRRNLYHRRQ